MQHCWNNILARENLPMWLTAPYKPIEHECLEFESGPRGEKSVSIRVMSAVIGK
jgi:hypothetical protein